MAETNRSKTIDDIETYQTLLTDFFVVIKLIQPHRHYCRRKRISVEVCLVNTLIFDRCLFSLVTIQTDHTFTTSSQGSPVKRRTAKECVVEVCFMRFLFISTDSKKFKICVAVRRTIEKANLLRSTRKSRYYVVSLKNFYCAISPGDSATKFGIALQSVVMGQSLLVPRL